MLGLLLCLGLLVGHNVRLAAAVGIGVICIMRVASVTHQGDARVRKAGRTRRGSWNQDGAPAGFEAGPPNSPASGTRKAGSRTEKIATRKAVWLLLLVLAPLVAESVSNTRGTGRECVQRVIGPLGLNQLRLRERGTASEYSVVSYCTRGPCASLCTSGVCVSPACCVSVPPVYCMRFSLSVYLHAGGRGRQWKKEKHLVFMFLFVLVSHRGLKSEFN